MKKMIVNTNAVCCAIADDTRIRKQDFDIHMILDANRSKHFTQHDIRELLALDKNSAAKSLNRLVSCGYATKTIIDDEPIHYRYFSNRGRLSMASTANWKTVGK